MGKPVSERQRKSVSMFYTAVVLPQEAGIRVSFDTVDGAYALVSYVLTPDRARALRDELSLRLNQLLEDARGEAR